MMTRTIGPAATTASAVAAMRARIVGSRAMHGGKAHHGDVVEGKQALHAFLRHRRAADAAKAQPSAPKRA